MSAQPQLHYFISNRTINVGSNQGASIAFEKGKPTHVPRFMHGIVMEKGILPCDKDGKPLDAESAPTADEKPVLTAPEDAEGRNDAIEKVCREMVKRNTPADFTAGGTPNATAVSFALGWKVDQKEVRAVWVKIRPEMLNPGGQKE